MMDRRKPVRVVQWATGGVGVWSLRQIIDRSDLELVGVWVSGSAKEGLDAGRLCGRPDTGVIATRSKEILALEADVVVHTARAVGDEGQSSFDADVLALLASGKNVISTVSYYSPQMEGEERIRAIEEACAQGSSTLYGSGVHLRPGTGDAHRHKRRDRTNRHDRVV
jgi:2,4-diaminopentanoate dehydrogenase